MLIGVRPRPVPLPFRPGPLFSLSFALLAKAQGNCLGGVGDRLLALWYSGCGHLMLAVAC